MKYKVGDRVKIREDLVVGNVYGAEVFVEDMGHYKGNMATITAICGDTYRINIDNEDSVRHWHWSDEMFEEKYEYHTLKFNVGDKVKIRKDLKVGKKYNELILSEEMYAHHEVMTIKDIDDDYIYECEENEYYWGEDMLEKVDEYDNNSTVDVGFHLDYCGHRVLKDVWQGETGINRRYYTKNYEIEYIIPIDNIDFIIPHEVD